MPNYTNLPERHYVDKARRLSLGGKDSDTYFDGETLETIIESLQQGESAIVELNEAMVANDAAISGLQEDASTLQTSIVTLETTAENHTTEITKLENNAAVIISIRQIESDDGYIYRVDADYSELVYAIENRKQILCRMYDPSFTEPVTNFMQIEWSAEELEEYVLIATRIVTNVNYITLQRYEITFPPTSDTPNYNVTLTEKLLPIKREGTFTLTATSVSGSTNAWSYCRQGNVVYCTGSLSTTDGADDVFASSWTGLPFAVAKQHQLVVCGNGYLSTIELNNTTISVKQQIRLSDLTIVSYADMHTIEFSYVTSN